MPNLNDENFVQEIKTAQKLVLVDFWASYCSPCFILVPILEKLAEEYKDKIILAKVNLETAPVIAQKYGIDRIPTVILFKDGKPVSGFVGVRSESIIREWLEENLKNDSEKIKEIIKECEDYAKENKFKLNPNKEVIERIIKGLLENEKKYGKRYCVCRRITGNPEADEKIVCPCIYAPKEIEEQGHCFCGLFVR